MQAENFSPLKLKNVSRETIEKLQLYGDILIHWQKSHNLISPSTLPMLWERHFLDSAQLVQYISPTTKHIIDLGSGAGFPGMVLAIITNIPTTLIESNTKKCAFLNEIKRQTFAPVKIIHDRIERVNCKGEVIVSRALCDLNTLIEYAFPKIENEGICYFLKGKEVNKEIEEANKYWNYQLKKISSNINCNGVVLELKQIERKQ